MAALQMEYSLIQREIEREHFPEASALEPVHPYLMFDDALLKHYLTPDMDIRRVPAGYQAA